MFAGVSCLVFSSRCGCVLCYVIRVVDHIGDQCPSVNIGV